MSQKIHPRTRMVNLAQIDIEMSVIEIATERGLTLIEAIGAVARTLNTLQLQALRRERHPDDPDHPADLE